MLDAALDIIEELVAVIAGYIEDDETAGFHGGGCYGNSELLKRGSMRKRKEFYEYPRRFCKYLNYCAVCNQDIKEGEEYFDGGYGRRCHVKCAPPKMEPDCDFTGEPFIS